MKLKLTSKIAEIAGAFAADGCLQKDYLCMWGNITEDRQYYQKTIIPLFETIFNTKINLHEKESNSVYGFYLCRKKVVDFFSKELNFPIGSKSYVVEVPQKIIQSKNKKIFAAFIRGFADCDGSLSFSKLYGQNISKIKNRKHVYPRIFLKSVSYKLINQISFMLTFIEINHTINIYNSKKINEKPCSIITIRGEKRLKKWIKKIGFNNPVQITRYKIWKKFGFVPPSITIIKREKILKEEINPHKYYMDP